MKILHVIGSLEAGGSQTLIMNIYRNIDREKYHFDFAVHDRESGFYEQELLELGSLIHTMPKFTGINSISYIKAYRELFRSHSYDILHSHVRSTAALYLPSAKHAGMKTIVHSHSTSSGTGLKNKTKDLMQLPLRFMADAYLGCSTAANEWLFGKKVAHSEKCYVLKNGISIEKFLFNSDMRSEMRHALEVRDNIVVLGTVGRLTPPKNQQFLLQLMSQFPKELPFLLFLIGEGELREKLEKECDALGLQEKVRFLGAQSKVSDYLQAMDIFLLPSLYEGLGIGVIEALTADLPCLISDKVPKEVCITDRAHSLPIDQGVAPWITVIKTLIATPLKRRCVKSQVQDAGYDIFCSIKQLANLYDELDLK